MVHGQGVSAANQHAASATCARFWIRPRSRLVRCVWPEQEDRLLAHPCFATTCHALPRPASPCPALLADCFKGLDQLVKNYLACVPLVGDLRSPAMRPRHWEALQEATKVGRGRAAGPHSTAWPRIVLASAFSAIALYRPRLPGEFLFPLSATRAGRAAPAFPAVPALVLCPCPGPTPNWIAGLPRNLLLPLF